MKSPNFQQSLGKIPVTVGPRSVEVVSRVINQGVIGDEIAEGIVHLKAFVTVATGPVNDDPADSSDEEWPGDGGSSFESKMAFGLLVQGILDNENTQ